MKAGRQDVEAMVGALVAITQSMRRANRKGDASRLAALYAIAARPGSSPKELSDTLGIHASSATRQIQALERDGHVKVKANAADRRSCRVTLTKKGRGEIARLKEVGLSRFASFVAAWKAEEVRELARLLRKLEQSKASVGPAAKSPPVSWREK